MIIGVPSEIKTHEYRVGLTPAAAHELARQGHTVRVQANAGTGSGFTDAQYLAAGAKIVPDADGAWDADMVIKVKEPQASEYKYLKPSLTLFTYLHLAADKALTDALVKSKCTAIAYETVTDNYGRLPLLAPMSIVAGRMAIQAGARALEKSAGGRGVLLSGLPGVAAARVLVLGGGVVGTQAIRMATGLEADVRVVEKNPTRLAELDAAFAGRITTLPATAAAIEEQLYKADLVIGAVLIPGAAAPRLITKDHLKRMQPGSVIVDVAIDQGGCAETSKPTTHAEPTYTVDGIVHYCVANMPGAVARTSTLGLVNATLPFVEALAGGVAAALDADKHLRNGINVQNGDIILSSLRA